MHYNSNDLTSIDSTSGPLPFVSFGSVAMRDLWHKMITELLAGMSLVLGKLLVKVVLHQCVMFVMTAKKDVSFMQQAESNIIIYSAIFYSPLSCRTQLVKDPSVSKAQYHDTITVTCMCTYTLGYSLFTNKEHDLHSRYISQSFF